MRYLYIFIILISTVIVAQAQGHSGHGGSETHNEPPHGGEIRNIGRYKLEIVINKLSAEEKLNIYILKESMRMANLKDATGTVTFIYSDGRQIKKDLINSDSEKLYCNVEEIQNGFIAIITIKYKRKEFKCEYVYEGIK